MKNFSKSNYSGKKGKQYKKDSESNFYSKNTKSSNKNNRSLYYPNKNQKNININEVDQNKNSLSSFKSRKPKNLNNNDYIKWIGLQLCCRPKQWVCTIKGSQYM